MVVAFSPDNPNLLRWLPDAGGERPLEAGFEVARTYPTPQGGDVSLLVRIRGFRGFTPLDGLGPVEGPYPQWQLPHLVRWALGPTTRLEIDSATAGRARLIFEGRSSFPDQTVTVKVADRVVGSHHFDQPEGFERFVLDLDLAAGRQVVELAHSHWFPPSETDARRRAVLLRTLVALHPPAAAR